MTSEHKIWEILQIIEDARVLAPKGKLVQYDARKIDPVVARDDHEQIFERLEKDDKVIEIHTRPDYINEAHYRFYVLPGFEGVYEKYKQLNQERARKVALKSIKKRVRFDTEGNLYLDDKRIFTAGLASPEFYFLQLLWNNWEKQMTYKEIYDFVRGEMKSEVSESYQNFCAKMKSGIKKKCGEIENIIVIPTPLHFMMTNPVEQKVGRK